MCRYNRLCVHAWRLEVLYFLRQNFITKLELSFSYSVFHVSSVESLVSAYHSLSVGLQIHVVISHLFMRTRGGLNSSPHAYTAHTLSTEPSHFIFKTASPTEPGAHPFGKTNCPESLNDPPVCLPSYGITGTSSHTWHFFLLLLY